MVCRLVAHSSNRKKKKVWVWGLKIRGGKPKNMKALTNPINDCRIGSVNLSYKFCLYHLDLVSNSLSIRHV